MTQFRNFRPLLPALSLATAFVAAGAVQAQETDDLRRVPLCSLPYEMPLPASVLDRIRAREDFEDLLRYSSDNCPETALILTDGTTAAIGGATAGAEIGGEATDERRLPLCRIYEELPLSQRVLNRIRNSDNFEDLLLYASENCPEVALLLADTATATVPEGEDRTTREGPDRDRLFSPQPEPPSDDPPADDPPSDDPVTDGGDTAPIGDGSTGQNQEEG